MSEPCSFTAFVRMTPPAFAALMRTKTLEPLAEAIAASVTDGLHDVVVFVYLKKEQALFAYCYFRYDQPLDELLARPGIVALLKALQAKDTEGVDRAVVSHDANNFLSSPPSAGFAIRPGVCERDDDLDADTLARFDAWVNQRFFKVADQFGRQDKPWFTSSRILEPALRRKVERRLKARRLQIAQSQLPAATPLDPVRLFADYHYNGHVLLWRNHGTLVPLPSVDPYTLKQTAYGAADATQVVVKGQVIRTNPAKFKVLGNESTHFYVSLDGVFDDEARPIPGADPATFSVQGVFGRDRHRWYRCDGEPIDDVGEDGRVDESLYFLPFILLLGRGAVYLGECRLPVEAASCEVVRTRLLREGPRVGALAWLRDGQGEVIVTRWGRYGGAMTLEVQRCADGETGWAQAEARWAEQQKAADPVDALREYAQQAKDGPIDAAAYVASFSAWAAQHLDDVWREDPYGSFLWDGAQRYVESLVQMGDAERALAFFEAVRAEAWRWPSIFEPVAMACLALRREDEALAAVRRGAFFSFQVGARLLERPEIAALLAREDAADLQSLAAYLRQGRPGMPALPASLADHWREAVPERHRLNALQNLFGQFEVPGVAQMDVMRASHPAQAAACEAAYARFLNASMIDPITRRFPAYDARRHYSVWGELPGLHPAVHLIAACALVSEGLLWKDQGAQGPRREFYEAQVALQRAHEAASAAPWVDDLDWKAISQDPLFAPLLDSVMTDLPT